MQGEGRDEAGGVDRGSRGCVRTQVGFYPPGQQFLSLSARPSPL